MKKEITRIEGDLVVSWKSAGGKFEYSLYIPPKNSVGFTQALDNINKVTAALSIPPTFEKNTDKEFVGIDNRLQKENCFDNTIQN